MIWNWNIFGKRKDDASSVMKEEATQLSKENSSKLLQQTKLDSGNKDLTGEPRNLQQELSESENKGLPGKLTNKEAEAGHNYVERVLNGRMPTDGKDCLGCKIVATGTPLGISGYLFYHMRKIDNKKVPDKLTRVCTKWCYGLMIFGCLWFSFLSATDGWIGKQADENWDDYFKRDWENQKKTFKGIKTYINEKINSKS